MTSLGQGSVAPVLKLLLDIVWILLWIALALVSLLVVIIAADFVMSLTGGRIPGLADQLRLVAWSLPVMLGAVVALMIVTDRLRRIFATLIAGDPFVPENAGHLRVIALAIILYQVFRHAVQGVVALILTLLGQPVEGGGTFSVTMDIQVSAWFAAVALLVLAEVFREGARLRQEQKLTI